MASSFAEAPAWQTVAEGWRPLYGNFRDLGFSFEWHDFQLTSELNWARSFHPGSIELCLNLSGAALLNDGLNRLALGPRNLAFYHAGQPLLTAIRAPGERHQFVTVEYSPRFLARQFGEQTNDLHPLVRGVVLGEQARSQAVMVSHATLELTHLVESLRRPPVFAPARRAWFAAKATELAALHFFQPVGGELFCTRAKRAGRERVQQAQEILRNNLHEPPNLEVLARQVGCSHYYLSRLFSQEVGLTIQQYLRQIRLERAAELLRTGQCNVTEAAFAVGYNSLSHFSTAFHEAFGCCPGLYPLKLHSHLGGMKKDAESP
jgi:AraC family transcriptional regulator